LNKRSSIKQEREILLRAGIPRERRMELLRGKKVLSVRRGGGGRMKAVKKEKKG